MVEKRPFNFSLVLVLSQTWCVCVLLLLFQVCDRSERAQLELQRSSPVPVALHTSQSTHFRAIQRQDSFEMEQELGREGRSPPAGCVTVIRPEPRPGTAPREATPTEEPPGPSHPGPTPPLPHRPSPLPARASSVEDQVEDSPLLETDPQSSEGSQGPRPVESSVDGVAPLGPADCGVESVELGDRDSEVVGCVGLGETDSEVVLCVGDGVGEGEVELGSTQEVAQPPLSDRAQVVKEMGSAHVGENEAQPESQAGSAEAAAKADAQDKKRGEWGHGPAGCPVYGASGNYPRAKT